MFDFVYGACATRRWVAVGVAVCGWSYVIGRQDERRRREERSTHRSLILTMGGVKRCRKTDLFVFFERFTWSVRIEWFGIFVLRERFKAIVRWSRQRLFLML